jgi:hypothetical protein
VYAVAVVIEDVIFVYVVAPVALRYTLKPLTFVEFSVQSSVTECCAAETAETVMFSDAS